MFITDSHQAELAELAQDIATLLQAPAQSIYLEALYQSHTSPCSISEILNGWLAVVRKGGTPIQIAQLVGRVK